MARGWQMQAFLGVIRGGRPVGGPHLGGACLRQARSVPPGRVTTPAVHLRDPLRPTPVAIQSTAFFGPQGGLGDPLSRGPHALPGWRNVFWERHLEYTRHVFCRGDQDSKPRRAWTSNLRGTDARAGPT